MTAFSTIKFSGSFSFLVPKTEKDSAYKAFLEKSAGKSTWNVPPSLKTEAPGNLDLNLDLFEPSGSEKLVKVSWIENDDFFTLRTDYAPHELASDQEQAEKVLQELGFSEDSQKKLTKNFPTSNNGTAYTVDLMDTGLSQEILQNPNVCPEDEYRTPLVSAIYDNDVDLVKKLIKLPNIDLNKSQALYGTLPLKIAAALPVRIEILKLLLDAGADPTIKDGGGASPLYGAIRSWNTEAIKLLIKAAPEMINQPDYDNRPLLFEAIYEKHTEIVKLLLEAGADPYATYQGKTMLKWANKGFKKNKEIIKLLEAHGAIEKLPSSQKKLMKLAYDAIKANNLDLLTKIAQEDKFDAYKYALWLEEERPRGYTLFNLAYKEKNLEAIQIIQKASGKRVWDKLESHLPSGFIRM